MDTVDAFVDAGRSSGDAGSEKAGFLLPHYDGDPFAGLPVFPPYAGEESAAPLYFDVSTPNGGQSSLPQLPLAPMIDLRNEGGHQSQGLDITPFQGQGALAAFQWPRAPPVPLDLSTISRRREAPAFQGYVQLIGDPMIEDGGVVVFLRQPHMTPLAVQNTEFNGHGGVFVFPRQSMAAPAVAQNTETACHGGVFVLPRQSAAVYAAVQNTEAEELCGVFLQPRSAQAPPAPSLLEFQEVAMTPNAALTDFGISPRQAAAAASISPEALDYWLLQTDRAAASAAPYRPPGLDFPHDTAARERAAVVERQQVARHHQQVSSGLKKFTSEPNPSTR